MMTTESLSVEDAARVMGVKPKTVYRALTSGALEGTKREGSWSIEPESVARWCDGLNSKGERVDTARRSYATAAGELAEIRSEALVEIANVSQGFLGAFEAICTGDAADDAASFDAMTVGLFRAALDKLIAAQHARFRLVNAYAEHAEARSELKTAEHMQAVGADIL